MQQLYKVVFKDDNGTTRYVIDGEPMPLRTAERVQRGASINARDDWHAEIVPADEVEEVQP